MIIILSTLLYFSMKRYGTADGALNPAEDEGFSRQHLE